MLVQMMSAKLGLATGRNLPELCRDHFPRAVSRGMWVQAELVAIATDLAEVIGGAIALNLLFGVPLFTGGLITGLVAFGLLAMQGKGYRPFELAIAGLFAVILLGFLVTALRVDVASAAFGAGLLPRFEGTDSLLLATGIRCHGDAARHLPALGTHPAAHPGDDGGRSAVPAPPSAD